MRARREKNIERSFHPRPLRRLYRKFRNFMLTATSSLNDMMNVVVGRVKVTAGGQGAPLVAYIDALLLTSSTQARAARDVQPSGEKVIRMAPSSDGTNKG
jgi:hypothetical protein